MKEKLIKIWNKFDELCNIAATWIIVIIVTIIIVSFQYNRDKEIVKEAIKELKTDEK